MDLPHLIPIALALGAVALLYSSVGHGGASGYIAVMTLFGVAVTTIQPIALMLNILVASMGVYQFWKAGYFSWPLFWPFAVLSAPMAFYGGHAKLPLTALRLLIGVVLLFSAIRLFWRFRDTVNVKLPPRPVAIGCGGAIGLLSGLTGTGGGIFLTPMMLLFGWAQTKTAAAVSAAFILVNSLCGLSGYLSRGNKIAAMAWIFPTAVLAGGWIGSHLGSRRLPPRALQILLGCVLTIAGFKLIFTR